MTKGHPGRIVAQDVEPEEDGSGDILSALPVSQAEIEELLYGDDRPSQQRIERLRELAAPMRDWRRGDLGDSDRHALLLEIDEAIARLRGDMDRDLDVVFEDTAMDDDPLSHRETLSPDSDELDEIEERDEASVTSGDEPLDDDELDPADWDHASDPGRGPR